MNNKKNNVGLIILVFIAVFVIGGLFLFLIKNSRQDHSSQNTKSSPVQTNKEKEQKELEKVSEDNRMVYVFSGKVFKKSDGGLAIQAELGEKKKLSFKLDPFMENAKTSAEVKESDYITIIFQEPIYMKDLKGGTLHKEQLLIDRIVVNEQEYEK